MASSTAWMPAPAMIWKFQANRPIVSSAAIREGIYIGSMDHQVSLFEPNSKFKVQSYALNGESQSQFTIRFRVDNRLSLSSCEKRSR
jgi:hypothetical protein